MSNKNFNLSTGLSINGTEVIAANGSITGVTSGGGGGGTQVVGTGGSGGLGGGGLGGNPLSNAIIMTTSGGLQLPK